MEQKNVKSGIGVIGDIAWGTHFCLFYSSSNDLVDILVPYFEAGLENNELCVWVCWEPLLAQEATIALGKKLKNLSAYISKGQIEIVDYSKQHNTLGKPGFDEMVHFWIDKETLAFEKGFQGLRLTGNTSWLEPEEWADFMRYESEVDKVIHTHRMLAICPYSLEKCGAVEVMDVISHHRFALIRRKGEWEVIRGAEEDRLQVALEAQTQNYHNFLDNFPLGIRIITAEGELLYANQAILDIYGYGSIEELKNTPTKQRYTPGSYAGHRRRAENRKLGKPVPDNYEIGIIRKDGEVRYLQVFRREVTWNGETRFQLIYQDITKRNRVEKVHEFTKRLLEIANSGKQLNPTLKEFARVIRGYAGCDAVGIRVLDSKGNIPYQAYEGFSREFYESESPLSIKLHQCMCTNVIKGDMDLSLPYYTEDGSFYINGTTKFLATVPEEEKSSTRNVCNEHGYESVALVPIRLRERILGLIHIADKRTNMVPLDLVNLLEDTALQIGLAIQRLWAEQKLAEEKQRLEVTLLSSGDGIISVDPEGKVVLLNRVAEELTGWTQKEAMGRAIGEVFNVVDERNRKPIADPVEKVLKTGRVIGLVNHALLISRDGLERVIADSGAPIHDEQGRIFGVVLVFRDITELRRLQEEQLRSTRLESIGILAGGIAHDFNNILTAIMGNIGLAKRYVEPQGEAFERLDEAEKASVRAKHITQQLLTFSKGGAPIRKTADISEIIKETATFTLMGSTVRLKLSLPDDLWAAEVDEGQIGQVISNIVMNADQAMPQGGILNVSAKNAVIGSKGALPLPKGNYVEIIIEDHGIGVPREHLDRIFDPYFTTKHKGSGLGLTTSYSIIRNHGGIITFESALGVGTTFNVYLPASKKRIRKKREKQELQPSLVTQGKILVMDDEKIIREMLSNMLGVFGYKVTLVKDGAEAIERYTEAKNLGQPFEAVILDLTIPGGMGGREAIKKLIEIDPDIKAIVSSGYATDPIMADYEKHGFSAVVTKPYSVGELERTLRSILKPKK